MFGFAKKKKEKKKPSTFLGIEVKPCIQNIHISCWKGSYWLGTISLEEGEYGYKDYFKLDKKTEKFEELSDCVEATKELLMTMYKMHETIKK